MKMAQYANSPVLLVGTSTGRVFCFVCGHKEVLRSGSGDSLRAS